MSKKRECGDCSVCCQGVITGSVNGVDFGHGVPCAYLKENKCSIYKDRPFMCQKFQCKWLHDENFPDIFKPNNTDLLVYRFNERISHGVAVDLYVINIKATTIDRQAKQSHYLDQIKKWMKENNENWAVIHDDSIKSFGGDEDFLKKITIWLTEYV